MKHIYQLLIGLAIISVLSLAAFLLVQFCNLAVHHPTAVAIVGLLISAYLLGWTVYEVRYQGAYWK